jgi:membrane protease YdiL (CAAX protease family)
MLVPEISHAIKRHPIITFFVLTYVITWVFVPFGSFGAFGPLVAALIVAPLTRGRAGLKELGLRMIRWRVRWYWYLVAMGLPLAIHGLTMLINEAVGVGTPRQEFSSIAGWLLIFALRLINPLDGPIGEEPGWRGFALPGLQTTRSPLLATAILAVLITVWHVPLFFLEGGSLPPSTIVGGIVGPFAFTFMATWLFNHTGGSVLMTVLLHAAEGSIQAEGWVYTGLMVISAIGLVIFDWKSWRGPAPTSATMHPDEREESSPEVTA